MKGSLSIGSYIRVVSVLILVGIVAWLLLGLSSAQEVPFRIPNVVLVAADDECQAEIGVPFLQDLLLPNMRPPRGRTGQKPAPGAPAQAAQRAASAPMPTQIGVVLFATNPQTGKPDPKAKQDIAGLEALQKADEGVFFISDLVLPENQLKLIVNFVDSGKGILGIRSTLHAFKYPAKDKNAKLNTSFGQDVFGARYLGDHGPKSTTHAWAVPGKASHPILQGIYASEKYPVHCSSSLYSVSKLASDCEVLMMGKPINPSRGGQEVQPVAWTRTYKGGRVFFTTLGLPGDFEDDTVRRLMINAVKWAAGMDVTLGGSNLEGRSGVPRPAPIKVP